MLTSFEVVQAEAVGSSCFHLVSAESGARSFLTVPVLIWLTLLGQAFMAASLKSDEELVDWFRQRLVWDDPAIVQDLLKRGLFSRIYTPQVIADASRRYSKIAGSMKQGTENLHISF